MAISAGADQENSGFSDINVTPLTDVLLVLLIIFLITGSSITAPAHQIVLPEVITKEKAENANIVIDVAPNDKIYVGNEELPSAKLMPYLKQLAKKKKTDRVIINADSKTKYRFVVVAMDASRKAGLINIALATEHNKKGAAEAETGGSHVKVGQ